MLVGILTNWESLAECQKLGINVIELLVAKWIPIYIPAVSSQPTDDPTENTKLLK